jgi:uncharacterized protein YkwD
VIRRLLALLLLVALFAPLAHHTAQAAPQSAGQSTIAQLVQLVNQKRAAAGLSPLRVNTTLMAEAQRFSAVQAKLGRLSHRGVDGSTAGQRFSRAGYRWTFYGENLAAGQETPAAVVAAWLKSPSHRAVMMHRKAREIGIGHTFKSGDPAMYFDYWVMEVGAPR